MQTTKTTTKKGTTIPVLHTHYSHNGEEGDLVNFYGDLYFWAEPVGWIPLSDIEDYVSDTSPFGDNDEVLYHLTTIIQNLHEELEESYEKISLLEERLKTTFPINLTSS